MSFAAGALMRSARSRCLPLADRARAGFARGMATDPNAPAKVNAWEAPTDIPRWKEEHIVIAVLTGWAVVIFGAKKAFS